MKKNLLIIAAVLVLALGGYKFYKYQKYNIPDAPETISLEDLQDEEKSEEIAESLSEIKDKVEVPDAEPAMPPKTSTPPATLNIEIPFFSQAPHGNWDYPWQEACEEASILLVANAYQSMNLNTDSFNSELLEIVDFEKDYFGAYEHTTVAQTMEMIDKIYGLETKVHENPTFEDIQQILADGHLIVAPFAGKLLGNPYFRNGGPVYHMLVIKGYDAEKMQIVTHDVGTRHGANYVYSWSVIENALHDWHDTDIELGAKKIIEVLPE